MMIEFFWGLLLALFIFTCAVIVWAIGRKPATREAVGILVNGFKDAWRGCGFIFRTDKGQIELYKWITCDDENVCEDCLERATWSAMDIADWMKCGLPKTPEAHTACQEKCRCRLVLTHTKSPIPQSRANG